MKDPKEARQSVSSSACFMDLPEGLLTTILKQLPLQSKIHAQAVCRMFRDVLCNPAQGSSVWDSIHLEDPVFEAASPTALAG